MVHIIYLPHYVPSSYFDVLPPVDTCVIFIRGRVEARFDFR